ncbi:PRC-barrel domain containing protein [Phyllobacterium sp. SYP-B3895]|uniref:PRC-barrel domain-containing protein n=1 Tax=Phyllobacterium sp. SYP-B3895 TaxID=2663240 RepID=UPI00129973BB|nr:PRC-barrel domain-containing protein [Phyllobacterium sp. SYP-B3895]MRG54637.1 PRC-barrel domain containing protein [Phyllobacterium sp. SYP-B3895]
MIRRRSHRRSALACAVALFLLAPSGASAEEIGLVAFDIKEVAKGISGNALKVRSVVNDKGETIGRIDDFIFSRDRERVFAVLAVGDFVGFGSHLIAVPFRNLKFEDRLGSIVLPGASRAALLKLPVFLYNL